MAATVNVPRVPAVNVALAALVMCGGVPVTLKAPGRVAVPPPGPGFVTDTARGPSVAVDAMVMLAVIWTPLFTVTLLTAMSEPKLTVVAPRKLDPPRTTFSVCVIFPLVGETLVSVGAGLLLVNAKSAGSQRPR